MLHGELPSDSETSIDASETPASVAPESPDLLFDFSEKMLALKILTLKEEQLALFKQLGIDDPAPLIKQVEISELKDTFANIARDIAPKLTIIELLDISAAEQPKEKLAHLHKAAIKALKNSDLSESLTAIQDAVCQLTELASSIEQVLDQVSKESPEEFMEILDAIDLTIIEEFNAYLDKRLYEIITSDEEFNASINKRLNEMITSLFDETRDAILSNTVYADEAALFDKEAWKNQLRMLRSLNPNFELVKTCFRKVVLSVLILKNALDQRNESLIPAAILNVKKIHNIFIPAVIAALKSPVDNTIGDADVTLFNKKNSQYRDILADQDDPDKDAALRSANSTPALTYDDYAFAEQKELTRKIAAASKDTSNDHAITEVLTIYVNHHKGREEEWDGKLTHIERYFPDEARSLSTQRGNIISEIDAMREISLDALRQKISMLANINEAINKKYVSLLDRFSQTGPVTASEDKLAMSQPAQPEAKATHPEMPAKHEVPVQQQSPEDLATQDINRYFDSLEKDTTHLDLSNKNLDKVDRQILYRRCELAPRTIKSVNLSSNDFSSFPAKITGILTSLRQRSIVLQSVQLSNVHLHPFSTNNYLLRTIFSTLAEFTILTKLDLSTNSLSSLPKCLENLKKFNTNLKELDLSHNGFLFEDIQTIVSALPAGVVKLSLKGIPLDADKFEQLKLMELPKNLKVIETDLGNPLKDRPIHGRHSNPTAPDSRSKTMKQNGMTAITATSSSAIVKKALKAESRKTSASKQVTPVSIRVTTPVAVVSTSTSSSSTVSSSEVKDDVVSRHATIQALYLRGTEAATTLFEQDSLSSGNYGAYTTGLRTLRQEVLHLITEGKDAADLISTLQQMVNFLVFEARKPALIAQINMLYAQGKAAIKSYHTNKKSEEYKDDVKNLGILKDNALRLVVHANVVTTGIIPEKITTELQEFVSKLAVGNVANKEDRENAHLHLAKSIFQEYSPQTPPSTTPARSHQSNRSTGGK